MSPSSPPAAVTTATYALTPQLVDAKVAELEVVIATAQSEIEERRVVIAEARHKIGAWKHLQSAIAGLNGERPAKREPRVRGGTLVEHVLTALADGRTHPLDELAEGFKKQSVGQTLVELVKLGKVERPAMGRYRLKSAEPQAAVSTTMTASAPSIAGPIEPLRGAAVQSKCPNCKPTQWAVSIGMRANRYVFKCPNCRLSFSTDRVHP